LFCYTFESADSKAFNGEESHRNGASRPAILQVLKMNDLGHVHELRKSETPTVSRKPTILSKRHYKTGAIYCQDEKGGNEKKGKRPVFRIMAEERESVYFRCT
jgi:hypothetical protein